MYDIISCSGVVSNHAVNKQCRKNDVKLNIRLGGDLKILKTEEYQDEQVVELENDEERSYQSGCNETCSE